MEHMNHAVTIVSSHHRDIRLMGGLQMTALQAHAFSEYKRIELCY